MLQATRAVNRYIETRSGSMCSRFIKQIFSLLTRHIQKRPPSNNQTHSFFECLYEISFFQLTCFVLGNCLVYLKKCTTFISCLKCFRVICCSFHNFYVTRLFSHCFRKINPSVLISLIFSVEKWKLFNDNDSTKNAIKIKLTSVQKQLKLTNFSVSNN